MGELKEMKKIEMYYYKKVFVLGFVRSGVSVVIIMYKLGVFVIVND